MVSLDGKTAVISKAARGSSPGVKGKGIFLVLKKVCFDKIPSPYSPSL